MPPTAEEMIAGLNKLYDREEEIKQEIDDLIAELEQTKQDIELAEMIFMHQANKREGIIDAIRKR